MPTVHTVVLYAVLLVLDIIITLYIAKFCAVNTHQETLHAPRADDTD